LKQEQPALSYDDQIIQFLGGVDMSYYTKFRSKVPLLLFIIIIIIIIDAGFYMRLLYASW